jgi:hypothetical protein
MGRIYTAWIHPCQRAVHCFECLQAVLSPNSNLLSVSRGRFNVVLFSCLLMALSCKHRGFSAKPRAQFCRHPLGDYPRKLSSKKCFPFQCFRLLPILQSAKLSAMLFAYLACWVPQRLRRLWKCSLYGCALGGYNGCQSQYRLHPARQGGGKLQLQTVVLLEKPSTDGTRPEGRKY